MKKLILGTLLCFSTVFAQDKTHTLVKQMERTYADQHGMVIGGHEVPAGERTFQVSLWTKNQPICGGSIIADQWVLTAAHCVVGTGITEVLSDTQKLYEGGKRHKIVQIIKHPKYINKNFPNGNDLALIRIEDTFNPDLERLTLASHTITDQAKKGVVSGWGLTNASDTRMTDDLMMATQTLISDSQCEEMQGTAINRESIICAYDKDVSSCNGDSGGPLTTDVDSKTYSIGIVSYGPEKCTGYAAYTETANFADWIHKNIQTSDTNDTNKPGTHDPEDTNEPGTHDPEDTNNTSCPSGYEAFTGTIDSDGYSIAGNRAYYANQGTHVYKSHNKTFTLSLYKVVTSEWEKVKSAVSNLSYTGTWGIYALVIEGEPESRYSICAKIP